MTSLFENSAWLLGSAAVAAAVGLFFLLQRAFGTLPAGIAALAVLANLAYPLDHTALSLLLHVLVYTLLAASVQEQPESWWKPMLLGIVCAVLALLGVAGPLLVVLAWMAVLAWRWRSPASWLSLVAAVLALPLIVWVISGSTGALALPGSPAAMLARISAFAVAIWLRLPTSGLTAVGLLTWAAAGVFVLQTNRMLRNLALNRWSAMFSLVPGVLLLANGLWNDAAGTLYTWQMLSAYRLSSVAAGSILLLVGAAWLARPLRAAIFRMLERDHVVLESQPSKAPSPVVWLLVIAMLDLPANLLGAAFTGANQLSSLLPGLAVMVAFCAWALQQGARFTNAQSLRWAWTGVLALLVIGPGLWSALR